MKTRKDKLEEMIYDYDHDIDTWINIICEMKDYDFNKFDYEAAYNYLNEEIEEIEDLDKLKKIYIKMKKNKMDISFIKKLINNKLEENKPLINKKTLVKGVIASLILNGFSDNDLKNEDLPYEPYQFEEEELEDDDFYNEDID